MARSHGFGSGPNIVKSQFTVCSDDMCMEITGNSSIGANAGGLNGEQACSDEDMEVCDAESSGEANNDGELDVEGGSDSEADAVDGADGHGDLDLYGEADLDGETDLEGETDLGGEADLGREADANGGDDAYTKTQMRLV